MSYQILILAFCIIGCVMYSLFFIKVFLIRKRFNSTFVNKIENITEKCVTTQGKIKKLKELIEAPLSKKQCIGYLCIVSDNDKKKILAKTSKINDFLLVDDSATCIIQTQDKGFAPLKLKPTISFSNYSNVETAIKANDLSNELTDKAKKKYCFKEYCLMEDTSVCVSGFFKVSSEYHGVNGVIASGDNQKEILKITAGDKTDALSANKRLLLQFGTYVLLSAGLTIIMVIMLVYPDAVKEITAFITK